MAAWAYMLTQQLTLAKRAALDTAPYMTNGHVLPDFRLAFLLRLSRFAHGAPPLWNALVTIHSTLFPARMSDISAGAKAKSSGMVEPLNMDGILREIARTLQALSGQIAKLEHIHGHELAAGMKTLSAQITSVQEQLDRADLRRGAEAPRDSTHEPRVLAHTGYRYQAAPATMMHGAKPMPPPPPVRTNRSTPY
eukprot:6492499-Amphidinium_carterae.2